MDISYRHLNDTESDILTRLLELLNAQSAMTSDYSALRHFEGVKNNTKEKIIERANKEFGCDITPAYDMDFGELFEFLKANKTK